MLQGTGEWRYRWGQGQRGGDVPSIHGGSEDQRSGPAMVVPVDGGGHDPGEVEEHDSVGRVDG